MDASNVEDLLVAASFLEIPVAREACCIYMENHMDALSCLMIGSFADLHNILDLAEKAKAMALAQFSLVAKSTEFLNLPDEKVSTT